MLGKRVEYRPSLYQKVPATVDLPLGDFPVHRQASEVLLGLQVGL